MPYERSCDPRAARRRPARWYRSRPAGRALLCGATAALVVAVAGCGGGSGSNGGGSGGSGSTPSGGSATSGTAEHGTVIYGSLPPVGTPVKGGTITVGQLTGNTPTDISPIIALLTPGNAMFVNSLFVPLYNSNGSAAPSIDYATSAGNKPRFSDGDRTVTIPLKHGLTWSNGAPVDANDVLFDFALLKAATKESAANWGQYIPGQFPASVTSMHAAGRYTVVLHLDRPYNPGYFLYDQLQDLGGGTYPIPSTAWNVDSAGGPHLTNWQNPAVAKKIFDYLAKAGSSLATFTSNPLWKDGDGPFILRSFNTTNGSYVAAANPKYGLSPKPAFSTLSVQTYTSSTAELNAFKAGSLDVIPQMDASLLAETGALKSQGASVYGGPGFGWAGGFINFKDKTDHFDKVIAQLYVRRAIDHLINQPAIVKGVYKGAGIVSYGPVPSQPRSPYTTAESAKAPYPYDPSAAAGLLKSHGWKVVPGGQTTCAKPGAGAGECGAGIPAGTPLKFVWATPPEAAFPTTVLATEAVASEAKQAAGIDIVLQTKAYNFLIANYNNNNPAAKQYTNDWGVSDLNAVSNSTYPTQVGYDGPGASGNFGGYDDPTANRLMNASVHGGSLSAVKTELSYLTTHPPDFYFPEPDILFAVSKDVGGPADSWTAPLTFGLTEAQAWYRVK